MLSGAIPGDLSPMIADVALPVVCCTWPLLLLLIVPIVMIETRLARRAAFACRGEQSLGAERFHTWMSACLAWPRDEVENGIVVANVASTFIGVPFAFIVLHAMEPPPPEFGPESVRVPGFSEGLAWILRHPTMEPPSVPNTDWMLPVAQLVLLVPAFVATVAVEWSVLRLVWPRLTAGATLKIAWRVNLASYALLVVAVLMLWMWGVLVA